jgi:hypothetical protein
MTVQTTPPLGNGTSSDRSAPSAGFARAPFPGEVREGGAAPLTCIIGERVLGLPKD